MVETLKPLGGHAVLLLLVQLAALLAATRTGAELARRLGLPAVVGELVAGVILGPSVFGHYAPNTFQSLFPSNLEQFHLLDVVGTLGMALLLLLTGLETDLHLLRNIGRAALIASATGMLLPFGLGFVLGQLTPAHYLVSPDTRVLFSLFLATAMSISAMPVIAKILVDLDLTKRNIGLVILSAGVVDDTVGWLMLSLIAGAASQGRVPVGELGLRLLFLAGFMLAAAVVVYPLVRWLMRIVTERFRTPDSDMVLVVVITLLSGAITEAMGIHAVFGAFIAGVLLHQVPRLRRETVHKLESFVYAVLAPVFFGIVGLKVNLWLLTDWQMALAVVLVACFGKLVGCGLGAAWGGLRFWEATSIAVAMNARGAMELVVAMIGLSLGLLSPQMFSMLVLMAVVTSLMAPLGLRLTMPRVRMTDEEAHRILQAESKGAFDPAHLRVLLATGGGPAALAAGPVAFALGQHSDSPVTILHAQRTASWWGRLLHPFQRWPTSDISGHLATLKEQAVGKPPAVRQVSSLDPAGSICEEAARGYDLVVLGSSEGPTVGGGLVEEVVARAPTHLAILRAPTGNGHGGPARRYQHVLAPVDGSVASRLAVELAVRYAEVDGAQLTLAMLTERRPQAAAYADVTGTTVSDEARATPDEELERISVVFRASSVKPKVLRLDYDPRSSALAREVQRGTYDLVVLGAENRAIQHRLFFGYDNERLIRLARVPVLVVVPHLGRLAEAMTHAKASRSVA